MAARKRHLLFPANSSHADAALRGLVVAQAFNCDFESVVHKIRLFHYALVLVHNSFGERFEAIKAFING
jgi:hypothetical protein